MSPRATGKWCLWWKACGSAWNGFYDLFCRDAFAHYGLGWLHGTLVKQAQIGVSHKKGANRQFPKGVIGVKNTMPHVHMSFLVCVASSTSLCIFLSFFTIEMGGYNLCLSDWRPFPHKSTK